MLYRNSLNDKKIKNDAKIRTRKEKTLQESPKKRFEKTENDNNQGK